jgi:hypothetical protein
VILRGERERVQEGNPKCRAEVLAGDWCEKKKCRNAACDTSQMPEAPGTTIDKETNRGGRGQADRGIAILPRREKVSENPNAIPSSFPLNQRHYRSALRITNTLAQTNTYTPRSNTPTD